MPDALFALPRLAAIYDDVDDDRSDLDHYEAIIREFGARRVLDIGCGTGSLVTRLVAAGVDAIGVDPAAASLDVARAKPEAQRAVYHLGVLAEVAVPTEPVDLACMTGNVAQVFLTDEDWLTTLRAARAWIRPGGHLVFETRRPDARAWEAWDRSEPRSVATAEGTVVTSLELTEVSLPFVSFRHTYRFTDGTELTSDSTLRFRDLDELETSLDVAGFDVLDVRQAPDRPDLEYVVIAQRS